MRSKVEAADPSRAPARGVIPTSQVIVLKEQELDCDLATAIQRIRAAQETAHSRILVVAPDRPDDVESTSDPLPPAMAPTTLGQVARRGEESALRDLGARLEPLAACLGRYLVELRAALGALPLATGEAAQRIATIADWTEALATDLTGQVRAARDGFRPVDTRELCVEMAGQVEARFPGLRVTVGPSLDALCTASPAALAEAFFLGMALVAHRIGGRGALAVEFERCGDALVHRIVGRGEPKAVAAPECVARFRRLVVELHGGRIRHDDLGPGGTGLAIHLLLAS